MPAIRFGKVCELMGKAALIQPSFYEAMKALPDNERLQLYDAICEYSLNGVAPQTLPVVANSLFIVMKPNIDSSNRRYNASALNGKKGGAPRGNQNAKKQPKNNQTKQPKNKQELELELGISPILGGYPLTSKNNDVPMNSSSARLSGRPPADELYDTSWKQEGGNTV